MRADPSHPWAGRSLRDLLRLTRYRDLRAELSEAALEAWIEQRPYVVQQWLMWSADKRTSGGFYLLNPADGKWVIGQVPSSTTETFATGSAATAEYILRELDFWATVSER